MSVDLYYIFRITAELVLYSLAGLFLAGVVIVTDLLIRVRRANKELQGLRQTVEKALTKGQIPEIRASDGFSGRVIARAVSNIQRTPEALNEVVSAEVELSRPLLTRGLNFLGTMGANAPFIGLFGTVLGIMTAFHDMALAGHAGPKVVMQGISEALIATAVGLLVAIPAVMSYNYLKTKVNHVVGQTEALFKELLAYSVDRFEMRLNGKQGKDDGRI